MKHQASEITNNTLLRKSTNLYFFAYYSKRYNESLYSKGKLNYKNNTMAYTVINSHYKSTQV